MKGTLEHAISLAGLERAHGTVLELPPESDGAQQMLSHCLTGARVYQCTNCGTAFTIELDGETAAWDWYDEDDDDS